MSSVTHALMILKGRRTGDRNAAFQLLNEMKPEEYKLRNRMEARQYARMKTRPAPVGKRPRKRWTMG